MGASWCLSLCTAGTVQCVGLYELKMAHRFQYVCRLFVFIFGSLDNVHNLVLWSLQIIKKCYSQSHFGALYALSIKTQIWILIMGGFY